MHKKVNPSGPGALLGFDVLIARLPHSKLKKKKKKRRFLNEWWIWGNIFMLVNSWWVWKQS
jgi:hypothetical protein